MALWLGLGWARGLLCTPFILPLPAPFNCPTVQSNKIISHCRTFTLNTRLENPHALRHVSSRVCGLHCVYGIKEVLPCRQAAQFDQGMRAQEGIRVVRKPASLVHSYISKHYLQILASSSSLMKSVSFSSNRSIDIFKGSMGAQLHETC